MLCFNCNKEGSILCPECHNACYCCSECQLADAETHKDLCEATRLLISERKEADSFIREENWKHIKQLPKLCELYPLPKSHSNPLQLEHFIPYFMLHFIKNSQSSYVSAHYPLFGAIEANNTRYLLSYDVDAKWSLAAPGTPTQEWIGFEAFFIPLNKHLMAASGLKKEQLPTNSYLLFRVFMMLTCFNQCYQLMMCFGTVLSEAMKLGLSFTYKGEPIVGWTMSSGRLTASEEGGAPRVCCLDVKNFAGLTSLIQQCQAGARTFDAGVVTVKELCNNPDHVWFTFVTASGDMFDLDLAQFQFGRLTPQPYITPVTVKPTLTTAATTPATTVASEGVHSMQQQQQDEELPTTVLSGLCRRHTFQRPNQPTLDQLVYWMTEHWVRQSAANTSMDSTGNSATAAAAGGSSSGGVASVESVESVRCFHVQWAQDMLSLASVSAPAFEDTTLFAESIKEL